MHFPSINPTSTAAWQALKKHFKEIENEQINSFFEKNPRRFEELHEEIDGLLVDYSKNRITTETLSLLQDLAKETKLKEAISAYFGAEKINQTEGRAVLHTALRGSQKENVQLDGKNVLTEVAESLKQIEIFSDKVISGEWKGYSGKEITDIVNIGIGGSDLGPQMVVEALSFYKTRLNLHFISNVEGDHVFDVLQKLNPETTLCIVVSKSFSTQETLANAKTAKSWFVENTAITNIEKHFVAVSSNISAATKFGIDRQNIFPMWDWVGGRFSLWSSVGLSIACAVGYTKFEALLAGAHEMDAHFRTTDFEQNIPVTLGLISIWYNNFFQCESEAIVPYTQYLSKFVPYLQQASMESNGKQVDRNGEKLNYQTGNILWGSTGTNAQHAFFQLLHQGTKLIPIDFIGFKKPLRGNQYHHDLLMANFFAQTEALMQGKNIEEVSSELAEKGICSDEMERLAPFKIFEGNRPTNTLLLDKLTPHNLGKLIALYEHKIFVQGVIWNIFSYDQWGVEYGKQLAEGILKGWKKNEAKSTHDASTNALLSHYKNT